MLIETVSFEHPFGSPPNAIEIGAGATVTDIIRNHNLPPEQLMHYQVVISVGAASAIVPMSKWHLVRPKAGAFVTISQPVHGPLIGPIFSAIIAAAAPAIATAIGFTGFAATIATAVISVVGALLISALIPPPKPPSRALQSEDGTNFTITGSSNAERRYGVFPILIGRHLLYPPKSARGYTQMDGQDVIYHGRYTFGYGPISLETLKIGTTDITAFEGVEIEFRNVDEDLTIANIPEIEDMVVGWRDWSEPMVLYPDNITQDGYNILLNYQDIIFRETRNDTTFASVDIRFPRGLLYYSGGSKTQTTAAFEYYYRLAGTSGDDTNLGVMTPGDEVVVEYQTVCTSVGRDGPVVCTRYALPPAPLEVGVFDDVGSVEPHPGDSWVFAGTKHFTNIVTSGLQYTHEIQFPTNGKYEVMVRRVTEDDDVRNDGAAVGNQYVTESYFSVLRSFKEGSLPNDPDMSEVAIRIKASDQLNGVVQTLNAVAQQLVPKWDGAAWGDPEPNRHPAWAFARILQGPMNQQPLADNKILLDDLLDWATEEPHWTCDGVFDQVITIRDALDAIAASGRASRGFRDLKHTIIRDGGAGPIVGHLTPHNSYNFDGEIVFPKAIHGFKVQVISEQRNWQTDEYVVYADGYDETNATEFETLPLPMVVLSASDIDQSNGWRLGRYHLAQAIHRPERISVNVDLEHMPWSKGDKIRVVHDVSLMGLDSSLIKNVSYDIGEDETTVIFTDRINVDAGTYTFYIRDTATGDESSFSTSIDADGDTVVVPGQILVYEGDLVQVVEMGTVAFEGLIANINHLGDLQASIELVPAASIILQADQGVIPPYVPSVSNIRAHDQLEPPIVFRVFSGEQAALVEEGAVDRARIGVEAEPNFEEGAVPDHFQLRWKPSFSEVWEVGPMLNIRSVIYSNVVNQKISYNVDIRVVTNSGIASPWVNAGSVYSTVTDRVPGIVRDFEVQVAAGQSFFTWADAGSDISHYRMRFSSDVSPVWSSSIDVNNNITASHLTVPARNGTYLIKAISQLGVESADAVLVTVNSADVAAFQVVETVNCDPDFTGTYDTGITLDTGTDTLSFLPPDAETLEGIYTSDTVLDLGAVYETRLKADATVEGVVAGNDLFEIVNLFDELNLFDKAATDWSARIQIAFTSDDPLVSPVWSAWENLSIGEYIARAFKTRIILTVGDATLTVKLTALSLSADVPKRIEEDLDVTAPIGGVTVSFTDEFRSVPSLLIDGQGLPSGFTTTRTVTATGFTIEFFDSGASSIAATFDWHAIGFGKKI